jgi:hypothetical protein
LGLTGWPTDGKRLGRLADGHVRILDAHTSRRLVGHDFTDRGGARGVAFLPDTTHFAVTGDGRVSTLDAATGKWGSGVKLELRPDFVTPAGRL